MIFIVVCVLFMLGGCGGYDIAGNFCEVYISRFSLFDRICESLSHKFVNITIQTHNISTQITKLIPRNVCSSAKSQNFMPRIFPAIQYGRL